MYTTTELPSRIASIKRALFVRGDGIAPRVLLRIGVAPLGLCRDSKRRRVVKLPPASCQQAGAGGFTHCGVAPPLAPATCLGVWQPGSECFSIKYSLSTNAAGALDAPPRRSQAQAALPPAPFARLAPIRSAHRTAERKFTSPPRACALTARPWPLPRAEAVRLPPGSAGYHSTASGVALT